MLVWRFEFIYLRGMLPDRKSHIIDLEAQSTLRGGIDTTSVNNVVTNSSGLFYYSGVLQRHLPRCARRRYGSVQEVSINLKFKELRWVY
jgi:hypothetical protein